MDKYSKQMENKLYREVSVTDRLPLKNGGVIGICDSADGLQQFYFQDGEFVDPVDDYPMPVIAWLEEVKLPTKEEIRKVRNSYSWSHINPIFNDGWRFGVKFILEILKGGKDGI